MALIRLIGKCHCSFSSGYFTTGRSSLVTEPFQNSLYPRLMSSFTSPTLDWNIFVENTVNVVAETLKFVINASLGLTARFHSVSVSFSVSVPISVSFCALFSASLSVSFSVSFTVSFSVPISVSI